MAGHDWWGAPQWAAFLEYKELPIKAASKAALASLEEGGEENLSGHQYAALLLGDPLLALRLLREANRRLPRRLARDITTPLGILMALGTQQFKSQIRSAPEAAEANQGFMEVEHRATLGARIAFAWGSLHHDLDQGELALAALLADAGEIELWAFVPELPQKALDELHAGRASRSDQAQRQACGFAFRDLSLELIERGGLPPLIKQLIRGDEGLRAQLARLAVDAGRHLSYGRNDPALPHDLIAAAKLTHAPLATVAQGLPSLTEEERGILLRAATTLSE
ncbi:MAG: HDOD domain-containing protein [Gallionellaceae bacterium]|nr:HDOD domain-containing protein [Gallionellaceae bacterium]